MAGPNSAPNGDKRLTSDEVVCRQHGEHTSRCSNTCTYIRYREWMARKGQLRTGKTQRSSSSR